MHDDGGLEALGESGVTRYPREGLHGAGAAATGPVQLTAIEWQVVGLLAQSLTVEEVAVRLGYEVDAVRIRRAGALAKLARSPRYEAAELRRALEG